METTKQKAKWYGPKQIGMIIFTGVLMLLSACFVGGQTNTVIPYLAGLRGWDSNTLTLFNGIACILDGAGILIWARLSRKNAKLMAGIALIVMAICLVLFGFSTSLPVVLIVMLIMGLSSACFSSTCAMTLTANWWPTKKGVVLGWSTMGIVLMSVVYAPYIPSAYNAIGVPMTQVWLAVLTVVIAIICFIFVKNTPEEAGTTPDGLTGVDLAQTKEITRQLAEYKSPFTPKKIFSSWNNWAVSLCVGLPLMVAMTYISTTIPALLSYGYDYKQAVLVFTVGGIVALIGSWAFGMIDQKLGTKKAVILYIIFVFVAIVCALFMKSSFAFAWLSGIILFCANGAGRNLLPSYVGTIYGRWDYPAAYQLMGTLFMMLCGAGVMVPAFFRGNYTAMYIFDLVVLVIAFILAITSKDKFIGKPDTEETGIAQ